MYDPLNAATIAPAPMDLDSFEPAVPEDVDASEQILPNDNSRQASSKRPAAMMEEVEDEDAPGTHRWIEDYPEPAGSAYGKCTSIFEKHREKQKEAGQAPWVPFRNEDEWEMARWLMTSGVSQEKINNFLRLEKVGVLVNMETELYIDVGLGQRCGVLISQRKVVPQAYRHLTPRYIVAMFTVQGRRR